MGVTRTRLATLSRLDPWAPPLALMAVIFFLSAQPDLVEMTGFRVWDSPAQGRAVLSEYGALCFVG